MLKIAFDIDDTIYKIDHEHKKQIPDFDLIQVLKWFYNNGDKIFVWSENGINYAKSIIDKLGLTDFVEVIPKEKRSDIDLAFDDEKVNLAFVNVLVKREKQFSVKKENQQVILYVDGGCSGNSQKNLSMRKMVSVVSDEQGNVLSEEISDGGSNNIAEFLAIYFALKYCVENNIKNVEIRTDSKCAYSWYHKGPKLKTKMNDINRVLKIKRMVDKYLSYLDNVVIKNIKREENLAGHYIEKKYCL